MPSQIWRQPGAWSGWRNEFPELTFIAMDALAGLAHGQMVLEIAKRTPNIIWDNSGAHSGRFLLRFVEEAGSHKLVLGSTYYSFPPSYSKNRELALILESGMGEEDMANVLSLNVKRLFRLAGGSSGAAR